MQKGLSARISGKVQGVWFRGSTQLKARELGVTGWVKNEPDESVRLQAFGEESALERLLSWCHSGPKHARVEKVHHSYIPHEIHQDFIIVRE